MTRTRDSMRKTLDKYQLYAILVGKELFLVEFDPSWPVFVPLRDCPPAPLLVQSVL